MANSTTTDTPREKLTKKAMTADHLTWCPGCGDFAEIRTGLTGLTNDFGSRKNRANPV
jgi:pyruvate/2-oxoacid:ferredoxin oxidoreductase beta subunit